jgi:hypothetical protein
MPFTPSQLSSTSMDDTGIPGQICTIPEPINWLPVNCRGVPVSAIVGVMKR